MSLFEIYLLTRLDTLSHVVNMVAGVSAMVWLVFAIMLFAAHFDDAFDDDTSGSVRRGFVYSTLGVVLLGLLAVAIPSKDEVGMMLVGQWVTNNEEFQELPNNLARAANEYIEYIETLQGNECSE